MELGLLTATLLIAVFCAVNSERVRRTVKRSEERLRRNADNIYSQLEALLALYLELDLRRSLPATRRWAGSPDFLLELVGHIRRTRPKVVVECGCGVSTLVIARALEMHGGGHLWSLEHQSDFAEQTREQLRRHGLEGRATVLDAPLAPRDIGGRTWVWYSAGVLPDLEFDMIVVDGPPRSVGKLARYPAGPVLLSRLAPGGAVFLDDAGRDDEQEMVGRFLAEFPKLTATSKKLEKGLVILTSP